MRLCDRWPLTNSLSLTAHGCRRFFARCPCARLLYMTDIERFCWRGFGLYLIADLRCVRLFTDRRWCALRHIVRKPDFHLLCMKIIPRRRFFCAGFLCLPYKRTPSLFLWCGRWDTLWRAGFRTGTKIICALARGLQILVRYIFLRRNLWRGVIILLLFRYKCRWCCRCLCCLLNVGASSLFLRCECWCALRCARFHTGTKILHALARRLRILARHAFQCRHSWGRTFLRRFWRDRRCCRCFCCLLNVGAPSLFLRCWCRCAARCGVRAGAYSFCTLPRYFRGLARRCGLLRL